NSTCTGPPQSSTAASTDSRSARLRWIAFTPGSVTSAKSMTTTSAPASCTSSATAAPMPVAPPTTNARLPSYRNASNAPMGGLSFCFLCLAESGDDAADLEIDDRVHVDPQLLEYCVPVLVELGGPPRRRRLLVELHGGGDETERHAGRRLALLHVAVSDGLGVGRHLEGVLHHRPLAGEVGQPFTPLVERRTREHLVEDGDGLDRVGQQRLVVGEPLVCGQLRLADDLAHVRPVLPGL